MAKLDVVLGLQWGDEGKGKIVDVLAGRYPAVARFQGGPNAGHSLLFEGRHFTARSLPSGIFRKGCINLIGGGVVLDPIEFREECGQAMELGADARERLVISRKATLILPTHRLLDAANEWAAAKGKKIGSTLRGIGPAYTDKIARVSLRAGDIFRPDFENMWRALKASHVARIKAIGFECDPDAADAEFLDAVEFLRGFRMVNGAYFVNELLSSGKTMLAEGAQGSMLDVDHGSYPFVTSSSTCIGGVCTGLGMAPGRIGRVFGVFKAYCTRVGEGPFPTELFDETGAAIRAAGHEFGAVTGRPRRTGWLDLVALKYAVMVNGVTDLVMMKADCLDSFETIKVCTAYKLGDTVVREVPAETDAPVEPVYTEFKGWHCHLQGVTDPACLPAEFNEYVAFLEKEVGVPIRIVSLGPDRDTIIEYQKPV